MLYNYCGRCTLTAVFQKQTWAELEKSRTRLMQKSFVCVCIFLFWTKSRTSATQIWVLVEVKQQINLQLTGKISLKMDSNSSLLLEYSCKSLSRGLEIHVSSKHYKEDYIIDWSKVTSVWFRYRDFKTGSQIWRRLTAIF